jgi:SAM-dependent methyltransferase
VLAVDLSPTGLKKSQALAKERGVKLRFEQADLETWNWPAEAFDVIAAIFFQFSEPAARTKIFAGIKRALKPGGLLLLEGYSGKQINYKSGGPSKPERLYTRALLEQEFAGFAQLDISEHDSLMQEGTSHVGMAALIDLVGRK